MEKFTVEIPNVKTIELTVHFLHNYEYMGSENKRKITVSQMVTVCIIRKGGLILGTGVAIQHPDDKADRELGRREAFKKAAKQAGWTVITRLMTRAEIANHYNPDLSFWKLIYSGWRKSLREMREQEKL